MNRHDKYFYHLRVLFNFCFTPVSSWIRWRITQTRESYRLIIDDIGADLKNTVANQLSAGRQFRVCFDNMDFRVLVNIILIQNSDKQWIAHYLTFHKVSCQGLDNNKPLVSDLRAFDNINYLLSKEELETL